MSQLADIREALSTLVDPIVKNTGGGQALAYANFDSPTPPVIHVIGPAGDEINLAEGSFSGEDGTYRIVLQGLVGTASDMESQRNLDLWLDAKGTLSVRAAIEADQTLAGAAGVWGVLVERVTGYQVYEFPGGVRLLGCEWTVRVETA